jgi:Helix-turn-helix domain
MTEPPKNPFDMLLDQIREVVREEIQSLTAELNGNSHSTSKREWLKAEELAAEYGLPKTWFEERGRAGDIARTKPGRYVLFKRRDVEEYLNQHCKKEPTDG